MHLIVEADDGLIKMIYRLAKIYCHLKQAVTIQMQCESKATIDSAFASHPHPPLPESKASKNGQVHKAKFVIIFALFMVWEMMS